MERIVIHNSKGLTLIEMLISIFLISIVGLALMQTTLVSMSQNLKNSMRDEAVAVADERMTQLRTLPFNYTDPIPGDLSATGGGLPVADLTVTKTVRSSAVVYTRMRAITDIGANASAKQVTITVQWTYKGQTYTHGITTILKRVG